MSSVTRNEIMMTGPRYYELALATSHEHFQCSVKCSAIILQLYAQMNHANFLESQRHIQFYHRKGQEHMRLYHTFAESARRVLSEPTIVVIEL